VVVARGVRHTRQLTGCAEFAEILRPIRSNNLPRCRADRDGAEAAGQLTAMSPPWTDTFFAGSGLGAGPDSGLPVVIE